jgi:hypothetical protein
VVGGLLHRTEHLARFAGEGLQEVDGMILIEDIETDMRYLQDIDPVWSFDFSHWETAANPFERRMAANLTPGRTFNLDLDTLERVMGSHTLANDSSLTFDLTLTSGRAEVCIVAVGSVSMPTIQAVECGIFRQAMDWYNDKGESEIRVTFFGNRYFWVHLNKQQKPTIVYDTGSCAP